MRYNINNKIINIVNITETAKQVIKKTLEQVEYISGTYNQNDSRTSDGTEKQSDKRPSEHWNNSSPKTAFIVILFW